jgi:hypothetical protein
MDGARTDMDGIAWSDGDGEITFKEMESGLTVRLETNGVSATTLSVAQNWGRVRATLAAKLLEIMATGKLGKADRKIAGVFTIGGAESCCTAAPVRVGARRGIRGVPVSPWIGKRFSNSSRSNAKVPAA